ncbi:MAG TPA: carbohydrate kinase [Paludibacteraceae bacterium]|jgi:fructokinase|nr:carbohydrate kinase [Paludibacteraceae bacterium]OPZ01747.1 MAG: 2-dehydro-3-deoxygluconokinase [Bacteroidetes bacterium ADurb.BinA395]MBP8967436.1 carbohydrate kinase [Paludibacteraceae bacterium]HOF99120.1 carbohydrate kinase [Paludibacteraceae bacterium]HOR39686.1 carbohydrate kinase [Paludibacteraceae bacterium]
MKDIIVGIGEILWDVLPTGKVLGGAPANFAYHISQLGFDGIAVSAIGNDELGEEIIENLHRKNMNFIIEKVSFPTGTVQVTLNDAGIPCYEICENVAWDNIPFTEEMKKLAQETKAVCFGSLAQRHPVSRQTIQQFLDIVPQEALKIFDVNLRQHFYSKELIDYSLKKCNILKINDEEILLLSQLFDWNEKSDIDICKRLLRDYSLDMIVLTKGTNGSCVVTPHEISSKPTPIVEVADTVGAGDAFTAGFVAGILKGKSVPDAHELAVEISAFVCTQQGAMPTLPQELINKISSPV